MSSRRTLTTSDSRNPVRSMNSITSRSLPGWAAARSRASSAKVKASGSTWGSLGALTQAVAVEVLPDPVVGVGQGRADAGGQQLALKELEVIGGEVRWALDAVVLAEGIRPGRDQVLPVVAERRGAEVLTLLGGQEELDRRLPAHRALRTGMGGQAGPSNCGLWPEQDSTLSCSVVLEHIIRVF